MLGGTTDFAVLTVKNTAVLCSTVSSIHTLLHMEMTESHRPMNDNNNDIIIPKSVDIVVSKIVAETVVPNRRNFENV